MTKRHYESVVIINASLEDDKIEEVIKKIEKTLTDGDAEITDVEKWGRKRLAYPIKKAKTGYYLVIRFKAFPSFISKLERFYRLEERIVRSLVVYLDKEALKYIAQKKAEAEKASAVTVNETEKTTPSTENVTEDKTENKTEKDENSANETDSEAKEKNADENADENAEANEKDNDENN